MSIVLWTRDSFCTVLFYVICVFRHLTVLRLGCQYHYKWLTGKTRLQNDQQRVDGDVKPYSLTHSPLSLIHQSLVCQIPPKWHSFQDTQSHEKVTVTQEFRSLKVVVFDRLGYTYSQLWEHYKVSSVNSSVLELSSKLKCFQRLSSIVSLFQARRTAAETALSQNLRLVTDTMSPQLDDWTEGLPGTSAAINWWHTSVPVLFCGPRTD